MQIANLIIDCAQTYMIAHFIFKIWKSRYGIIVSNFFALGMALFSHFKQLYIITKISPAVGFFLNVGVMIGYVMLVIDGTILENIKRAILVALFLLLTEGMVILCLNSWISYDVVRFILTENIVLAKVFHTLLLYFFIAVLEIIVYWKKGYHLKVVAVSSIVIVLGEVGMFVALFHVIEGRATEYLAVISSLYSILVILSYYTMTGTIYEILQQKKKKYEIEKMFQEQRYQYDYYMLAREQAEQARDLRHDMRNQLQTIQYLMENETDKEKRHAEKMLKKLEKKVEKLNLEPMSYKK